MSLRRHSLANLSFSNVSRRMKSPTVLAPNMHCLDGKIKRSDCGSHSFTSLVNAQSLGMGLPHQLPNFSLEMHAALMV